MHYFKIFSIQFRSHIKSTETQRREIPIVSTGAKSPYCEQPLFTVDNDVCTTALRLFCKHQLRNRESKKQGLDEYTLTVIVPRLSPLEFRV